MDKFIQHQGVAAPMLQSNIDTDAIIPSREMKRVSKDGLGEGLFAGWRYTLPGGRELTTDFILNKAEYANTTILLAGDNFGCGSSREHAVWALKEYGVKVVIASGFGTIFYNNCIRNGILPVQLSYETIVGLAEQVQAQPQENQLAVNLQETWIEAPSGERFTFDIEPERKTMLIEGLDVIDVTLKLTDKIKHFQQNYQLTYPWLN
ncbi:3-isopropylmalate dehydratase small subunit [Pseudocolwellia agarivorans]|uniref:3-isopropylmalate dehydratase small subunit n=1 Tax=Pseudocolwellia agarivorans TaxID=1911682 RepID=UPI000985A428|nr:3-isopropylmalate dehydratase small subunit [Pseudocolwellia agarivorans]